MFNNTFLQLFDDKTNLYALEKYTYTNSFQVEVLGPIPSKDTTATF